MGQRRRVHRVTKRRIIKKRLKRLFPNLKSGHVRVTSRKTRQYNCIAWAVGISDRWWDPNPGYGWPVSLNYDTLNDIDTIEILEQAYKSIGFIVCEHPNWEEGYETIALYADQEG